MTGSVAYLGFVAFISGLPAWLLMIYGGLIADRVPRRTLLLMTQSGKMTLAFILSGLVFLKWVQPWHILVLALLLGVANAFETPARKSLVADLVKQEDMTNAITLSDTMYYTSLVIGPAIGASVYSLTVPDGIGAILGSLVIAFLGSRRYRGKVRTFGSIILPLAMFAFALSRSLPVASFFLGLTGLYYVILENNNSAIVQSTVPDELRGRMIGLFALLIWLGRPEVRVLN